jgi:hypothetical protein
MLLGAISVITTMHALIIGASSMLATATTTLTAVLTLPAALARDRSNKPALTSNQTALALKALEGQVNSSDIYFLDSWCSFSIISNMSVFTDMQDIPAHKVDGLTGSRTLTKGGVISLEVNDASGSPHHIILTNVRKRSSRIIK